MPLVSCPFVWEPEFSTRGQHRLVLEFISSPRSAEHGALTVFRDPADTVPLSRPGEELGKAPTICTPPSGSDVLGGHTSDPPLPPYAHLAISCSLGDGQHKQDCKTQLGADAALFRISHSLSLSPVGEDAGALCAGYPGIRRISTSLSLFSLLSLSCFSSPPWAVNILEFQEPDQLGTNLPLPGSLPQFPRPGMALQQAGLSPVVARGP